MSPYMGKQWPGWVAWPDYTHPNALFYWQTQIKKFLSTVPIDGLWLDMDEPSNAMWAECPNKPERGFRPDRPPYSINNRGCTDILADGTVAMSALQHTSFHYNLHNLFGYLESRTTYQALRGLRPDKRPVIVSRSTFPGHGLVASHWLGDNWSTWNDLYYSVPGFLNFQLFGIPLVGADICGVGGDTTMQLCARWMQLGAFYPFARNHNAGGSRPQEPYVWPEVAAISRHILSVRYSLLPYYYTLFYQASTSGAMVARPLFTEFAADITTWDIDRQFLIGGHLLVSPVLVENATSVLAYFPPDSWYDFYTRAPLVRPTSGWVNLDAPLDKIPVHVRGGGVIPMQEPALTTAATRRNPFSLLVALSSSGHAEGTLYLDAGDGYEFESGQFTLVTFTASHNASNGQVQAKVAHNGYGGSPLLDTFHVLGVQHQPMSVTFNNQPTPFFFNATAHTLSLYSMGQAINKPFLLTWRS